MMPEPTGLSNVHLHNTYHMEWYKEGYDFDDDEEEFSDEDLERFAYEEMQQGLMDNITSIKAAKLLHQKHKAGTLEWVTRNAGTILVQDMSDAHVYNIVQHLRKTGKGMKWSHVFQAWITIFNKEIRTRKKNKQDGQ